MERGVMKNLVGNSRGRPEEESPGLNGVQLLEKKKKLKNGGEKGEIGPQDNRERKGEGRPEIVPSHERQLGGYRRGWTAARRNPRKAGWW